MATRPGPDPRPWFAHFNQHGDPSIVVDHDRPGFSKIADVSTAPDDYGRANALLIERAVNLLDELRAMIGRLRTVQIAPMRKNGSVHRAASSRKAVFLDDLLALLDEARDGPA